MLYLFLLILKYCLPFLSFSHCLVRYISSASVQTSLLVGREPKAIFLTFQKTRIGTATAGVAQIFDFKSKNIEVLDLKNSIDVLDLYLYGSHQSRHSQLLPFRLLGRQLYRWDSFRIRPQTFHSSKRMMYLIHHTPSATLP
jgi:hypothetical protein